MPLSENEISDLFILLNDHYGYDFSGYAIASLQRRIKRFTSMNKINGFPELKKRLDDDPVFFSSFVHELTVNVTEMFRDPTFFQCLQQKVFPSLSTYPFRKIWHAGCSTGEEVYSMAMLLNEHRLYDRTRIYATDINSDVIQKSKEGIYPLRFMQEYSTNYILAGGASSLSDYYTARYDSAIINNHLKKNIIFSFHNLVTDVSFNEFNLIVCRNVLIYFSPALQEKVIELFYNSLGMLGYLALGSKESMLASKLKNKFEVVDKKEKIFKKIV
ncbi:MAG: protein-glutamate O-methyltransferase CheR [Bacteroidetes bacterium]|nr:protein-glutamate O-methyltransferase CheR [Bacteroidota bacterium]